MGQFKPNEKDRARSPALRRRVAGRLRELKLEALMILLLVLTGAAIHFQDSLIERSYRIDPTDRDRYLAYSYADTSPDGGSIVTPDRSHPLSWTCRLESVSPYPYCGYGLQLDVLDVDLSNAHEVTVSFT